MSTDTARLRHDLRTPLNHIIGYTEMLLEDAELPQLRTVLDESRTVLGLVNGFLTSTGPDAGTPDLEPLRATLDGHLTRIANSAAAARPELTADLQPDLDRVAEAVALLGRLLRGEGDQAAPAAVEAPASVTGQPSTILVVDDDEANRRLLLRRLEREGYRVELADGGYQALERLRTRVVDLVLLDVMMPDLDGVEVLRRIRSEPRLCQLPVLMISALDELDSVVRCIELGAEDYLPKPFNAVLLKARIGACLEKKRLRDLERCHQHELEELNRTLEQRVQEQVAQIERLGRLKRFFSPKLAELLVADGVEDPLRTHRNEITVVFLDLRGFTSFAETAEPEEVMGVLRAYHREMGRLIQRHEGTLERFTGDGMMIFFNDPVEVPNPAERAVRMALEMQERVAELEVQWRSRGHDLALGIGIAQGYATLGAIGFDGRWDYAAIGSVTNLAARLCGEATGGQTLVSPPVAAAVGSLVRLEPVGDLNLRGFLRSVDAFSVVAVNDGQAAAGSPAAHPTLAQRRPL